MKLGLQTQTYVRKMKLYKIDSEKHHSVDFATTCYNIIYSINTIKLGT